jgi:hypothetical protein
VRLTGAGRRAAIAGAGRACVCGTDGATGARCRRTIRTIFLGGAGGGGGAVAAGATAGWAERASDIAATKPNAAVALTPPLRMRAVGA